MSTPPKHFRPEPFDYHEVIELDIDSLSNLGAGVGRFEGLALPGSQNKEEPEPPASKGDGGWVVFVPFCLPGERVKARIWKN